MIAKLSDSCYTLFLRKHYKVTSVADGVSAMYCLRKNALPDLIILNPDLTDFPDWELVKYMQSSHLYSSIPLLVIVKSTRRGYKS